MAQGEGESLSSPLSKLVGGGCRRCQKEGGKERLLKRLISLYISPEHVVLLLRQSLNRVGMPSWVVWIIVGGMNEQIHQVITIGLPCRLSKNWPSAIQG